ncbi:MAG: FecR protein [Smithella sp. PtaU1.Bin162]|nr:MAG: FecR protein [Smithella sp. PtaU1.Bin162]
MNRSAKQVIAFLLILQLIIPYPVFAAAEVGKFTAVDGKVTLTRANVTYRVVLNSQVQPKDLIVTGEKASATMTFPDESTITLQENSKMEIKEFMIKGKTRKGIFSMSLGKLIANVNKFIGGNNTFEVHSPTAVCGVRGTGFEFIVGMVGTQLSTTVTCTTGALSVSALSATGVVVATTTVVAGQTAIVSATGITLSAVGAGAGAGTAAGTTVTTATGTGTVTTGAAATGAATAGTAAGTTAAAGIGAGTIAAGAVVGAAAIGVAVGAASNNQTTTTHH